MFRAGCVAGFIPLHLFDDRPGARIRGRQAIQMTLEMLLDLAFRLDHETEADRIAGTTGDQSEAECSCIPERVQDARPSAELLQAFASPREMVGLVACSLL